MRELAINTLIQLLNDNQGNRISSSLSVGIASLLNQELQRYEAENAPKPPVEIDDKMDE